MALWLRTLPGLPEVQGSIPSTHMVVYNCLELYGMIPSSGVHLYMQTKPSYT